MDTLDQAKKLTVLVDGKFSIYIYIETINMEKLLLIFASLVYRVKYHGKKARIQTKSDLRIRFSYLGRQPGSLIDRFFGIQPDS
jgi:hypothetical protein